MSGSLVMFLEGKKNKKEAVENQGRIKKIKHLNHDGKKESKKEVAENQGKNKKD